MASTLERLTAKEVVDMVAFRWSVASAGGHHPFTEEALDALAELGEGMPRDTTILADNALLLGYSSRQLQIGRNWSRPPRQTNARVWGGKGGVSGR